MRFGRIVLISSFQIDIKISRLGKIRYTGIKFNLLYNGGIARGLFKLRPIGANEFRRCINLCSFKSSTFGLLMSKIATS